MTDAIPTPTIGEILEEEFLRPLEMTPYRLSRELHVSTSTVLDLVHGKRRRNWRRSTRYASPHE